MTLAILSTCFTITTKASGEEGEFYHIKMWLTRDQNNTCYGWTKFSNNYPNTITSDFYISLWQDGVGLPNRFLGEVLVTEDLSYTEEYTAGPIDTDGWSWEPGGHWFYIVYDTYNNVTETNESNNVASRYYPAPPPKAVFYFSSYDASESQNQWSSQPANMANGATASYSSTTLPGDLELLDGNNCTGSETGNISYVYLRTKGYYSTNKYTITLTPKYNGELPGDGYEFDDITTSATWSPWFEITNDRGAPETWTWNDIDNLECEVTSENSMQGPFTLYCSQVEVMVCYWD
jgi:hypothetical protein